MQIQSQAGQFIATGTADEILELLRGPRPAPQHDEHCKGYQWELYLQSAREANARLNEEVRRMIAERNARNETSYAQAAE